MWWIVVAALIIVIAANQWLSFCHPAIQLPSTGGPPMPRAVRCCSWVLYASSFLLLAWSAAHFLLGDDPLESYVKPANTTPMPSPAASRMLFFVVDRSGSMSEPLPSNQKETKAQCVKSGLLHCIDTIDSHGGKSDLLGLITFARVAKIGVPLSRDRSFLTDAITAIVPETVERLNGSAIGYALFKTVALLEACRSFANGEKNPPQVANTIILITDGLEEPHPADRADPFRSMRTLQALNTAAENHVAVNYINVDKNSYQQLLPDERDRLRQAIEGTGGRYYEITQNQSLGEVLSTIALSEKTKSAPPLTNPSLELGFWLLVFASLLTSLSRLFETAIVRVRR